MLAMRKTRNVQNMDQKLLAERKKWAKQGMNTKNRIKCRNTSKKRAKECQRRQKWSKIRQKEIQKYYGIFLKKLEKTIQSKTKTKKPMEWVKQWNWPERLVKKRRKIEMSEKNLSTVDEPGDSIFVRNATSMGFVGVNNLWCEICMLPTY